MDTKLIKQKILDLAIRGKLVPQNPADEPASILLERIKAEKAQLIKEGKIKKEKPLAPIEDVPFEIPESWEWCRINEITSILGDGLHGTPIYDNKGPYYFVNGNNLLNGEIIIKDNTQRVSCEEYNKYKKPLTNRTILVSINGTIGNFAIYNNEPIILGKSACFFDLLDNINISFICKVIESNYFLKYAIGSATGSTIKNVPLAAMRAFYIPLPPLEEQKRIVAEIDRWFKLIDELEKNQQDLHTAIQQAKSKILDLAIHGKLVPQDANDEPASVLLERIKAEKEQLIKDGKIKKEKPLALIEEVPFEIPESWEWCRLSEIGNWQSGGTPSRSNKSYYEGSIPWLKTGDLNDGFITSIPESISEEAVANSSAKLNPENSVLIAMYGATIGKVGILSFPATTNQACCACSYYKPVEMLYLFYFLLSQKNAFIAKGGGGAQPNISKEIIVKTEFPLPPLEEQKRIVSKIEELFTQLDKIEESLN